MSEENLRNLCTWGVCRLQRAPGSYLCEVLHKSELHASPPTSHGDIEAKERDPHCVACGHVHGSVNKERICLENEVRALRRHNDTLRGMYAKATGIEP